MVAAALPPAWSPTVESVADDGPWLHAWRAHAQPVLVDHVVVWPDWIDGDPPDHVITVRLDPGGAFGSGDHPSTRLTLAALQRLLRPGDRVLDLGCGSGVLAVAAALLGAGPVVALDIDPEAVVVTGRNAVANGVSVAVEEGELGTKHDRFDLVLANIGAGVLTRLARRIGNATFLEGHVVLSGLLSEQVPEMIRAFGNHGLRSRGVDELDGWASVVLSRF
jgi:ribosomal protein L11 methyltransferase